VKQHLNVARYSAEGTVECSGLYENPNGKGYTQEQNFQITYPSNCKVVSLISNETELQYKRVLS